jgi:hypothetical protein
MQLCAGPFISFDLLLDIDPTVLAPQALVSAAGTTNLNTVHPGGRSLVPNHHNGRSFPRSSGEGETFLRDLAMTVGLTST